MKTIWQEFWRDLRYRVARRLIHLGIKIMPAGRFKTELVEVLWVLNTKVVATVAAYRQKNSQTEVDV